MEDIQDHIDAAIGLIFGLRTLFFLRMSHYLWLLFNQYSTMVGTVLGGGDCRVAKDFGSQLSSVLSLFIYLFINIIIPCS
jgi:hypothetical protein